MIKIIKDGQKEFIAKCPTCGCEFSYQLGDIGLGSVLCPCCGGYVAHKEFKDLSFPAGKHSTSPTFTQQTTANWTAPDVTITSSKAYSRFDSLQIIHDLCIGGHINADVNGSLQIMKKVFPNAFADGIVAHLTPVRINLINSNKSR